MRKNKWLLTAALIVTLLLLIPALVIPTLGATKYMTKPYTFNTLTPDMSLATLKSKLGSSLDLPSTLRVVASPTDPTGADMVLRIDSAYTVDGGWAGGSDGNVDKNLTLGHNQITADHDKMILQAEYYIPSGSKGSFESQMRGFSAYVSDLKTTESRSWLGLWKLNLGTGLVESADVRDSEDKSFSANLEKDAWNTVSLVIDMDTGKANFYVNNILKGKGQLTDTQDRDGNGEAERFSLSQLSFNANNWIVAKLNKAGSADDLGGCLYINNALIQQHSSDMEVDLGANGGIYARVTLQSGRTLTAGGNDTILVNRNVTYTARYESSYKDMLAPVNGASIRLSDAGGMRFATQIKTSLMNDLIAAKNAGYIKNIEMGTLITPHSYVVEAGDFTVDALKKLSYSSKYLDVKGTVGSYYINGIPLTPGYDMAFVGSIVNIKPTNYDRLFAGVGYVKLTLADGTEKFLYSYDYTDAATQQTNYSRSIRSIAAVFVNNPDYARFKPLLQGFTKGLTVPSLSTTAYVKNVQYSYSEFFFQNAAGVACRLVYDGNNGWRLQAQKGSGSGAAVYGAFDPTGAAQALSEYLGEAHDDVAKPLTVSKTGSTFVIRAEGTESYVALNYTGAFNLRFFSPSGTLMNNVKSITASGTNVTLTGDLTSGEAIYGGGERFDAANKRGKWMQLYSYDAYNAGTNQEGTYTVIPLFTSSRGSGIYVNRYEYMTADWGNTSNGNTSSSVWEISIQNNLIDCYFYATGKMTDAIKGYTDLTGHATLPAEWAQGVLICRYSPDFNSLEGETMMYAKLKDIPGYEAFLLGTSADSALATTKTSWTKGDKLYNTSGNAMYVYADGDGDGDYEFVRISKKVGAPMGAGIKAIVEKLTNAGMKPTAMVLEGLNWTSLGSASGMKKFTDVMDYLNEKGISLTLYMAVGNLSRGMPGYKTEYQVHANITYNVTKTPGSSDSSYTNYDHTFVSGTTLTYQIPKNSASNNPDNVQSGTMNYLDITNPEAVDWYIETVWGQLIDLGVDGCKIDFCEIMPDEGTFDLIGKATRKSDNKKVDVVVGTTTVDYKWYDESILEGDNVHHAYASYYISVFYQRLKDRAPDGFIVLNRGGGIGMQRNPYMWAGDQTRTEVNLTTQLMAMLNSGISGLPFVTPDMAGYAYAGQGGYWNGTWDAAGKAKAEATESEIFARAIEYMAFSTSIQTHGDVRHMYDLSAEAQRISASFTQLHDDLIPYIQKYSQVACDTGMPVLRLMVLQYQNDKNVYSINDQYMFGDALLVAPVLKLGVTSRSVYLPQGQWLDLLTGTTYNVGSSGKTITCQVPLGKIPVFLKTTSEDANILLRDVFNGSAWQSINGGVIFKYDPNIEEPVKEIPEDPTEDDIFKKN